MLYYICVWKGLVHISSHFRVTPACMVELDVTLYKIIIENRSETCKTQKKKVNV